MKKMLLYIFLACVLNFISCNTHKEFGGYPNFNSVQHKKSSYQANNRIIIQHPKSNFLKTTLAICSASSSSTNNIYDVESVFLKGFTVKNRLQLRSRESFSQNSVNDQFKLTASLSKKPFVASRTIRPDTNLKTVLSSADSLGATIKTVKITSVESHENQIRPEKNKREVFAILSLISALLIVPALLLALPVFFFMLTTAAILFGALGLKSKRKKMAAIGLVLGIIAAFFYLIAIIYVLTTPIM